MPTAVLAPATTAGNSTDVTVAAGTPVNVGLYRDDEGPIEADCVCPISRKDPAGDYQPTGFNLNGITPNLLLVGPGVFRITRPEIGYATGIQTD